MRAVSEVTPTGPGAFDSESDIGHQAQAAILLGIAAQLRGDRVIVQATAASAARSTDMFPIETLDEFPVPHIAPASRRHDIRDIGQRRFGARWNMIREGKSPLADMADDVYRTQSISAAGVLAVAALDHDDELVRVAAAHAALAVSNETETAYQTLVKGTESDEELVRDVAATALARYNPADPALQRLIVTPRAPGGEPAHTSTVIHGTFAANGSWWKPGGNFFSFMAADVWSDLYTLADFYSWSGGYSDGARDQGASLLAAWISAKGVSDLSVATHSHGGSVAMLASWRGVSFDRVVLLSCPVHPAKYDLNFGATGRVTSVRVKMDLVLLADGSAARFADTRYREHVLPVWFNHSASHDPGVWRTYNVKAML